MLDQGTLDKIAKLPVLRRLVARLLDENSRLTERVWQLELLAATLRKGETT